MRCLDCPQVGDFEGRPTPRATCCMDKHADTVTVVTAEPPAGLSRQARRAWQRQHRKDGASGRMRR